MPFMKVATVQEVPSGGAKQVAIRDKKLALFNVNGTFYAIDDACSHRGASLAEGACQDTEVICPWHGASFDVRTGAHLGPPASRPVAAYKVQVVGEEVQVEVP